MNFEIDGYKALLYLITLILIIGIPYLYYRVKRVNCDSTTAECQDINNIILGKSLVTGIIIATLLGLYTTFLS
jgi:hypothetical protein